MTDPDEILIYANKLANTGAILTAALINKKLSQQVPLATIKPTLKHWQHQPGFVNRVNKDQVPLHVAKIPTSGLLDSQLWDNSLKKVFESHYIRSYHK